MPIKQPQTYRVKDLTLLGQRIRFAREKLNISRQNLADLMNAHLGTVGLWERGDCQPSRSNMMNLLRFLGITMGYFRGESEYPDNSGGNGSSNGAPAESIADILDDARRRLAAASNREPDKVSLLLELR
jgi:transcriptional regulator with XRE-family HTH domain